MCAQVPLDALAGQDPALALLPMPIRPAPGLQQSSDTRRRALLARWRGLCFDRKHNAWRVRIFYAGKQRHVGRFKDDVAAARAYDKAAFFLYGPKAILNFSFQDVLSDPTPVPACIRMARQQAEAAGLLDANGTPLATNQQAVAGSACGDGGSSSGADSPVSGRCAAPAGLSSPGAHSQQQHSVLLQGALSTLPQVVAGGSGAVMLPAHQQQQQHILLPAGGGANSSANSSAHSSCSSGGMWHTTAGSSSSSNLAALQPGMPAAAWQLQQPMMQPAGGQRVHGVQVLCAPPLPPGLGGMPPTAVQLHLLQLQQGQPAPGGAGSLVAPPLSAAYILPAAMATIPPGGGAGDGAMGLCAATAALAAVSCSGVQLMGPAMHPAVPLQLQQQPEWLAAAMAPQQQLQQQQAHLAAVTAAAAPVSAAMLDPTLLASLLNGCSL